MPASTPDPSRIAKALAGITRDLCSLIEQLVGGPAEAPAVEQGPAPALPPANGQAPLRAALARILGVCTAEPQSPRRIAGKLGRTCNSYFRAQLRELWRLDRLERCPGGGYRLRGAGRVAG